MNARCVVLGMMVATSAMTGAKESVSIRVTPAFSFAPTNLTINTSVEPNAANRSMEVVAGSGSFYRSSTMPLEGHRSARMTVVQFRSVPPGEYEVRATVFGADGRPRAISHTHVNVMESGASR